MNSLVADMQKKTQFGLDKSRQVASCRLFSVGLFKEVGCRGATSIDLVRLYSLQTMSCTVQSAFQSYLLRRFQGHVVEKMLLQTGGLRGRTLF